MIRRDCAEWLEAIERATPTLVVRAIGPDGCDTTAATLRVDGELVAAGLSGRPIPVDPGEHQVEVSFAGHPPSVQRIVAAQGEAARLVTATLAPAGVVCGAAAPAAGTGATAGPVPLRTERPIPVTTWILGGSSLAAFGVAAGLGAWGFAGREDLEACSPNCGEVEIDDVRARFIAGDVLLGVGVAAGVGALVTYLLRPEVEVPASAQVGLSLGADGAFGTYRGAF